jgi:hypothetical protein
MAPPCSTPPNATLRPHLMVSLICSHLMVPPVRHPAPPSGPAPPRGTPPSATSIARYAYICMRTHIIASGQYVYYKCSTSILRPLPALYVSSPKFCDYNSFPLRPNRPRRHLRRRLERFVRIWTPRSGLGQWKSRAPM